MARQNARQGKPPLLADNRQMPVICRHGKDLASTKPAGRQRQRHIAGKPPRLSWRLPTAKDKTVQDKNQGARQWRQISRTDTGQAGENSHAHARFVAGGPAAANAAPSARGQPIEARLDLHGITLMPRPNAPDAIYVAEARARA